jgi:N utilization substance protein A
VYPDAVPAEDLLNMEGMDEETAYALARKGIGSVDELAEQSVDELMELDGMSTERAAQLIMKAREPWFAESEQE